MNLIIKPSRSYKNLYVYGDIHSVFIHEHQSFDLNQRFRRHNIYTGDMRMTPNISKQFFKPNIQWYRKIVQYLFLATVVLIGIKFSIFVNQLASGISPTVTRPPGIEAFLPISSLISLKYWLVSGIFNHVHPSGLIILLMALATGLLLKRGFCSWICPIGLLAEYLNRLHKLIFRKNVILPPWLDYPLRSLKYLLLSFFLWAIVVQMNAACQLVYKNTELDADQDNGCQK